MGAFTSNYEQNTPSSNTLCSNLPNNIDGQIKLKKIIELKNKLLFIGSGISICLTEEIQRLLVIIPNIDSPNLYKYFEIYWNINNNVFDITDTRGMLIDGNIYFNTYTKNQEDVFDFLMTFRKV